MLVLDVMFKKVEIYGFKSFADRLTVDFSEGITCIVGPNGCGKSNVSDAIRWVLGEQSSKALRGTNMQDVIFKGTEKRGSMSYCEVSLVFDNTNKIFPVDYTEVVLSRKLYRSGESEYLVNRQPARLKDITNLLHDSGIDRDGLTIISQGQVAEIINSKPESRRGIFEEAAGISKFKARKDEAERKLERTNIDMQRVNDVTAEIERSLGPLMKQAEAAQKYLAIKEELKNLEINAYIYSYDNVATDKAKLQEQLDELSAMLEDNKAMLEQISVQYSETMDRIGDLDRLSEQSREAVLNISLGLERVSGEKKLVQEKLGLLEGQDTDLKAELDALVEQLDKMRMYQSQTKTLHAELVKERENLAKELSMVGDEYAEKTECMGELNKLNIERVQLLTKQRTIQNLIDSGEGYRFSVRKIVETGKKNSAVAEKFVGVVAQMLTVPAKLEVAVEVALGNSAQNIITKDDAKAKELISMLARENWGRATFLPLTSVKGKPLGAEERKFFDSSVLGVASELIKYEATIEPVIQSLLGRTAIVKDLDSAIAMAKQSRHAFRMVTLDGDVIETRGSITGGSRNALNNNLWHTNNLAQIEKDLEEVEKKIALLEKNEDVVEVGDKLTGLKVRNAGLDSEISALEDKLSAYVNSLLLLEKSVADKKASVNAVNKSIEQTRSKDAGKFEERAYSAQVEKLESAKAELSNIDNEKETSREFIASLEKKRNEVSAIISDCQEQYFRLEVALNKMDVELEAMQQRIYDEYGLNYSSCYMFRTEGFNYHESLPKISDLRKQINKLGPVNLNAIEDSLECKLRYDDYCEQVGDLGLAKADLEKVIADLSREMEAKFKSDFNKINHNFQVVFKELFGGGTAKLVLTDPNDYLNSGIDIIAEPPGKKLANITLLSGGEKALTAIAILFAILKLRPMPFCLLDEIEAALDDSNVGRFAQYLKNFSKTTQFIVITHRKPTMELADNLYGVTMEEKGVSKLVSVKLSAWEDAG